MKRCGKCGAVQNDDRTVCLDCGTLLGRPMTEDERERHEAALSDTLEDMAERTEEFYVTPAARVMGIISIAAVVALAVMLMLLGGQIERAQAEYLAENAENAAIMIWGDARSSEVRALEETFAFALLGMVSFIGAALFLLIPKVMWWFETLRYRLWFDADPHPSFYATAVYAVIKYGLFALGCAMLLTVLMRFRFG